ncbi:DUF2637 domain-containing protein [Jiangella muralis]|uniref:DUF2637 domain-containing protein n=1 Tax=Jiangella muralis TaxID=702383 RepID=UPI0009FAA1A7|nr:DUF2637 domain-containing protein [Jiangella muralis]
MEHAQDPHGTVERTSIGERLRVWVSDPDVALIVTVFADALLALGAFALSFDALRELALAAGLRTELVWIWPLVVDGFMVVSTINAVVLSERIPRAAWYPGIALVVFAVVSIAGNGLHAARHADMDVISVPVAAVVSAIPAVALLIISHLIVVLLIARRRNPPRAERGGWSAHRVSDQGIEQSIRRSAMSNRGAGERSSPGRASGSPAGIGGPARNRADDDLLAAWVVAELQAGRTVTGDDVAARIGMSPATGRRRLRALRTTRPDAMVEVAQRGNGRRPVDGTP